MKHILDRCLMLQQLMLYSCVTCKKNSRRKVKTYTWLLQTLKRHLTVSVWRLSLGQWGLLEFYITLNKSMYNNTKSRVWVDCKQSNLFSVNIGKHLGSVWSSLCFSLFQKALSLELWTGCPWKLLHADNSAIVTESLGEVRNRLSIWKKKFTKKILKANVSKTEVLISGMGLDIIKETGELLHSMLFHT